MDAERHERAPVAVMKDCGDGRGLRPIWFNIIPTAETYLYAAPPPPAAVQETVAVKAKKLPSIGEELYEHYAVMSAQTHEALVKEYARKIILSTLSQTDHAPEIAALRAENERLREDLKKARREANDNVYMAYAYRIMLGPIATELAKKWEDYGVTRQHTSWGPDAHKLTGEERAQILLDTFTPPRAAVAPEREGSK